MEEDKIVFKINPTLKIAEIFFVLGIITIFFLSFSKYFILLSLPFLLISSQLVLSRKFSTFLMTDDYLSSEIGIINKKIVSIPLNRVQNVRLRTNFFQRLINIGEISIESAAEAGGLEENEIIMFNIDKPDYYYKLIMEAVSKNFF